MGLGLNINAAFINPPPGTPAASGKPLYRDSLTGTTSTLLGRVTDSGAGLTQGTWVGGDQMLAVSGGKIVRGTDLSATFANLLPVAASSMSISFVMLKRPTASGLYVDILRSTITGAPPSYRLEITATTCRIMKRFSGSNTYLSGSVALPVGALVVFRKRGSIVEVLINGVVAASVVDTDITSGAYAGFAAAAAVAGFEIGGPVRVNVYELMA